jgi:signal transduction histidine kinase
VRLWPGSLRARLLLVSTLIASAALVLCLVLLYLLLVRQLNTALDEDLTLRSHDLATAATRGDLGAVERDPAAQLYTRDGTLVSGSPSLAGVRLLSPSEVRGISGRRLEHRSLPSPHGPEPARQLARPIREQRVLAVAVSTHTVRAARDRLTTVLFVATPALIAALAVAVRLVVAAALRPVRALTRGAATISTLDTGYRLPRVPGDDEIAELGRTLGAMLTRLRVTFDRERAFVDDASHELRTPVAVLRAQLELAARNAGRPEEVERSLRASLTEAERLSRLTEDLLLLARDREGTLALRYAPLDLLDVLGEDARVVGPAVGLRIEVAGDPVVIEADADRLRQVIANLATNSAAAGASVLRLTVERGEREVTLRATDDGPGFPPRLLESAFERFARAGRSAGSGLGLAIVRAVVAAHDGTVEAANGGPLGGAIVTVRLPAAPLSGS